LQKSEALVGASCDRAVWQPAVGGGSKHKIGETRFQPDSAKKRGIYLHANHNILARINLPTPTAANAHCPASVLSRKYRTSS